MIITSLESFRPTWQKIESILLPPLIIFGGILLLFRAHYNEFTEVAEMSSIDKFFVILSVFGGLLMIGVGIYLIIVQFERFKLRGFVLLVSVTAMYIFLQNLNLFQNIWEGDMMILAALLLVYILIFFRKYYEIIDKLKVSRTKGIVHIIEMIFILGTLIMFLFLYLR